MEVNPDYPSHRYCSKCRTRADSNDILIWSTASKRKFVRNGIIIIDQALLQSWNQELLIKNYAKDGRRGRRYVFPDSLLLLVKFLQKYFMLSYRDIATLLSEHLKEQIQTLPDFSTLWRRGRRTRIDVNFELGKNIMGLIDATGVMAFDSDLARLHQWQEEKGAYLQLEVSASISRSRGHLVDNGVSVKRIDPEHKAKSKKILQAALISSGPVN